MPRPQEPPELNPRQPTAVLGWTMQKTRQVHGWAAKRVAAEFGCSASHISRVEHGKNKPSRALVQFYEEAFTCEGLLLSLFEVAEHNAESDRRRVGGHRPVMAHAVPGDASAFIDDTVPHGTLMQPGEVFTKIWRIRNAGMVPWVGRRLERQGPLTGPGMITSGRYADLADTRPGEVCECAVRLKAPTYAGSSIAYFKMVDAEGSLCFPEAYQVGLDVMVRCLLTPC